MSTTPKTESAAKKDVQKLQRAIVDGLEDVKAQDIRVFNTEHLSPLFERVIVASGTSNRQTKALATSVRDAVREAGFDKPRTEGEENGEWIIVDCGAAVAHIMQPAIRQYYHLEEIWGDTPVKVLTAAGKAAAKKAATAAGSKTAEAAAKPAPAAKTAKAGKEPIPDLKKRRSRSAALADDIVYPPPRPNQAESRKPAAEKPPTLAAAKKAAAKKVVAKKAAPAPVAKPRGKVLVVGEVPKRAAAKTATKTAGSRPRPSRPPARRRPARPRAPKP
ncbi:ribosome silencing factor [Xylophilus rhododendri]|uniref:Ribosomal silencing factor RsfS n=1 Tax=Xylophilus rhododendri TaxID=2697032 RepID=A0A857J210_9BURK|nr:ribosome silencing factor [Xylophilus rhododendri]QHI97111.1 ribosome silencing factor [Xylophilus rhododendri]